MCLCCVASAEPGTITSAYASLLLLKHGFPEDRDKMHAIFVAPLLCMGCEDPVSTSKLLTEYILSHLGCR